MKVSPCKNCTDRYPACHGSCERFKEWRVQFEEAQRQKEKVRKTDELLKEGHYKGWRKYKNCGRKK